jgi:hypothetical protein
MLTASFGSKGASRRSSCAAADLLQIENERAEILIDCRWSQSS